MYSHFKTHANIAIWLLLLKSFHTFNSYYQQQSVEYAHKSKNERSRASSIQKRRPPFYSRVRRGTFYITSPNVAIFITTACQFVADLQIH